MKKFHLPQAPRQGRSDRRVGWPSERSFCDSETWRRFRAGNFARLYPFRKRGRSTSRCGRVETGRVAVIKRSAESRSRFLARPCRIEFPCCERALGISGTALLLSPLLFASSSQASATEPDDPSRDTAAEIMSIRRIGRARGARRISDGVAERRIASRSPSAASAATRTGPKRCLRRTRSRLERPANRIQRGRHVWRCHYSTGQRQGRCLFVPPLGF